MKTLIIDRYEFDRSCVLGNKRMLFDITLLESIKQSSKDDLNLIKELLSKKNNN